MEQKRPATDLVQEVIQHVTGRPAFKSGDTIVSEHDGTTYRLSNVTRWGATFRRAHPKVRGKAARRLEKLARRRAREGR